MAPVAFLLFAPEALGEDLLRVIGHAPSVLCRRRLKVTVLLPLLILLEVGLLPNMLARFWAEFTSKKT